MRRRVLAGAAATLALAAILGPAPARSQDSLEAAKRRELEEVQRQAREKREAASRLKGQETEALSGLRRTERELNVTRKRLRSLRNSERHLEGKLRTTKGDLSNSIIALRQQRTKLARRLRNLYKSGVARELEFLLSPQPFARLIARWDYLVMVAEQDRILLEDVQAHKELVEANKQRLELNIGEVKKNAGRISAEDRRLATLRKERASKVQTIQSQRQNYEAAAAELEKTARALERLLAQLERQRRGRAPEPYTGDFAKGRGRLDWPLHGGLAGRFGRETHPKWGTVTLNNGIDIEAPVGSLVRSVAKGRVDYTSEDFGTYGQIAILNHGDGYYTLYGHLSEILVSVGEEVASGQAIARSGDSGSLKGAVLHFEVRKGGTPLNPEDWLR